MAGSFKVFFEYVLGLTKFFFLDKGSLPCSNSATLLLTSGKFYFLALHLRFSSRFFGLQLADLFSYESAKSFVGLTSTSVLVYNFHGVFLHERFFFFVIGCDSTGPRSFTKSLNEIFPNSVWLEREVLELHAVTFEGKKDVRNLMLQYGDSSAPFRKSFPSIGTREMFYDGVNDTIAQGLVSLQV